MEAIPQAELMEELGVAVPERKSVRDRLLGPGDWFKDGNKIMIRPSGETKLRVWKEEPGLVAEARQYRVCNQVPNPQWVMIGVDGEKKKCAINARDHASLTKGKTIWVQEVKDKDGTSYRERSLS